MTYNIEEHLNHVRVALDNAVNQADISAALAEYLYDAPKIAAGRDLWDKAQAAQSTQQTEYGEQYAATNAFNEKWDAAKDSYNKYVVLARVAFKKDLAAKEKLKLDGRRKQTFSGWLLQAQTFYKHALDSEAFKTALAGVGLTEAKLLAGQAQVVKVVEANSNQTKERGEAQQSTRNRDEALEALDDWFDDFKQVATVALADTPELLESMGFLVRS